MRVFAKFLASLLVCGCAYTPVAAAQSDTCAAIERRFESEKTVLAAPQISSLLFTASDNGCDALVGRLLQTGASVAAQDRVGGTALTHAARNGQTAIIRILLDKGAQINHRMIDGSTPLFTAIEKDRTEAANLLAANGADVTIAGRNGVTPLAAAAFNRNEKIVAVLLAHGADPKAADSTGKPPIVYAAAKGSASVVSLLLTARPAISSRNSRLACQAAVRRSVLESCGCAIAQSIAGLAAG